MNKSQYNSLQEWRNAEPIAYNVALRNNWIEEIRKQFGWSSSTKQGRFKTNFKNFSNKIKNKFKKQHEDVLSATIDLKQSCLKEASKHKTPWEWQKASPETYNIAMDNGWLSECSKKMKSL